MVEYNDLFNYLFVAPGLSEIVIVFMGDLPLEVRPWVLKLPRDNPWASRGEVLEQLHWNVDTFHPGFK